MIILILTTLVIYQPKSENNNESVIELGYSYELDKDSLKTYPVEEIMAAVAYHECYNLSKLERWLVMEALYNRVQDNFNSNGTTIDSQLLANRQFTGLWKYNPQQFKFDTHDTLCIQNRKMAIAIINGSRMAPSRIYYWAGTCDSRTAHGRWMKKVHIKLPKFIKSLFK